jgi:ABC-type uncharacterized transport system permease subunit
MVSPLPGFSVVAGVAAAGLYAVTAGVMIRDLRRQRTTPRAGIAGLLVPALVLHGWATWHQIDVAEGLYLGFFTAGSLVSLVMSAFVLLAAVRIPVQNLLLFALPFGLATALASPFISTGYEPRASLTPALVMHILVSIIAYSLLFMAASQAVIVAYQDRALRTKRSIAILRMLPPLETMESFLFALLWAGISALTLAIASGFVFLDDMFAQQVVHHTVLSLASWVVYATLLAGHHLVGWRSVTATYWTLIAFSLLVLAYFGSKFVLEIILER